MKTPIVTSLALAALLSGCSDIPPGAYFNHGSPESLLDMSSEVVNVSLDDSSATDELAGWINQEQPSRADLMCGEKDPGCAKAKSVLEQFNVPYEQKAAGAGAAKVALHYERVIARDCENRYIDNSINPYNLNHPTFGCSVAANIVQHVTDKRQFVNPNLLDYPDGENAAAAYRSYIDNANKPEAPGQSATSTSLISSISGNSSR